MKPTSKNVKLTYYLLTFLSTLAASFIWGINTIFLLDAGLSNTAAFAANAFFTLGQVIFEVPTGIVADTRGRKTSYALGALTLLITTVAYYLLWKIHGPFWAWAIVSALLGLGFTFFSGATQAWLVDSLDFTGFKGNLDGVFARGQALGGIAMLAGSVGGGLIAQYTNLGVPYIVRAGVLAITLAVCLLMMHDYGFTPDKGKKVFRHMKSILSAAIENGWKSPPVRDMMLSAPFAGVTIFVFYAMQPHLLKLYGDSTAYSVAGISAAVVAGAQIVGSMFVNHTRRLFKTRTVVLITALVITVAAIAVLGLVHNFWVAIAMMVIWGLVFSIVMPVRQAYLNGLIKSEHRATVLSFDSLLDSSGGAVTQPALGKIADSHGYGPAFLVSAVIQAGALPFLFLARKKRAVSDPIAK